MTDSILSICFGILISLNTLAVIWCLLEIGRFMKDISKLCKLILSGRDMHFALESRVTDLEEKV